MKKLLLASLLIFGFLQQGVAQRYNYDNSSNFFIGLNIGSAWHSSDVKNVKKRFPLAAGFTLGGTFNRDYGKFLTYDLRFRFLFGSWYGQDTDTTHAIQDNYAVNDKYNSLGYSVQNFRAKQRSLDLEFAVHFNRVKERTGLDPYIFGGLGFTFTNTQGDLLKNQDALDAIYPYNENPTGDLITKDYNTSLDKNNSGEPYDGFEANLLPSLGVGIGYYFSSNFSVGLEHRTTFFNGDYFDGTHLNQEGQTSKIKKDLYHYTSIYFKWYLRKSRHKTVSSADEGYQSPQNPGTQEPIDKDEPEVNRKPDKNIPPIVNFTNPSRSPLRTTQRSISIRAKTEYINSAENITFMQNGVEHNTFIFDPKNNAFESKVNLSLGQNIFKITGVNSDGSDDDQTIVIYERKAPQEAYPPTVNIIDPVNSPYNINKLNYVVKAAIHNVKARNQVQVTLNNKHFSDFSFNPNGEVNFSANINLRTGVNTLRIVGTNTVGSDEDETVLIYTRIPADNSGYPPTVNIIIPNKNPFTTSKTKVGITAKIDHIQTNQQVEVIINGVSTTNFNYNNETKKVQFDVGLSSGNNTIRVKAKNPYGTDMDDMQIIYKRGYNPNGSNLPPLVSITSPNINPYTSQKSIQTIGARVEHVDNKGQIEVKVNENTTTNFTFNQSTGNVQLNMPLSKGSNNIHIKATNNFGSDSDISQIIYREKIIKENPPKIKIITPDKNPLTTNHKTEKVIATVENVSQKDQIKVEVNGKNISNFSFNTLTKEIRANVNLSLGSNKVKMSVTNNIGKDSDETQINKKITKKPIVGGIIEKIPCDTPSVVFMNPNQSVSTTNNASFEVTAKLTNVQNKNQINTFLNSRKITNFSYNTSTKILRHTINLKEGKSDYTIRLTNKCSTKEEKIILKYEPPVCGVDITLDHSDFCLSKPGGVIKRDDLLNNNNNFQYDGTAKALYFKAGNNGLAKVNGEDYPLIKGTYYHFMGKLTVHAKKINNQWHVCVESSRNPLFGKGSSRPEYPCGESIDNDSDNGSIEEGSSIENVKPIIKPHLNKTKEPHRRMPKDDKTSSPSKEPSSPASRKDKNQRKPKRPR